MSFIYLYIIIFILFIEFSIKYYRLIIENKLFTIFYCKVILINVAKINDIYEFLKKWLKVIHIMHKKKQRCIITFGIYFFSFIITWYLFNISFMFITTKLSNFFS